MKQYLDLLNHVKNHGDVKHDRTGTGTISVFGYQMRYDLSKGFPLLTTKRSLDERWILRPRGLTWHLYIST